MSGQEEFEKWFESRVNDTLHNTIACENLFLDKGEFLVGWEACAEQKDKVIDAQAAEIAALRKICRDAYEVWAGSEGIPEPETAAEAYLLRLVEQMRDIVKLGLGE